MANWRTVLVPVGTLITERPPERSVQARLRIRLLRKMSGVEASFGIRMQDTGRWDPSVEDWAIFRPLLSRGLTATNQNVAPYRPDLLQGFRPGARRASPVAQCVLVIVLSLTPRQSGSPLQSVCDAPCCLHPAPKDSAFGATIFRGYFAFTIITAR